MNMCSSSGQKTLNRLLPGAALYICMALTGVTCSPPPPSATIEAIEAIETHDEDREGKTGAPCPAALLFVQDIMLRNILLYGDSS